MRLLQKAMVVIFSLGVVLTFTGCEQQGPAEKAGGQMDEAAQQATEKAKEAGEAVDEKVEKAGEYLDDAAITAKIKSDILSDPLLKVLEIKRDYHKRLRDAERRR